MFSLYERGRSELNVLLRDGDVLNIPDNQLNKVFVLGEVGQPSTLFVRNGKLTLAEAISDTQGFGGSANPGQVYVIRGKREYEASKSRELALVDRFDEDAKLEIYHLDSTSPDALLLADQFQLKPRDVIYVSPTELSRFSRVFADVGRIVNTTAQTVILQRTLRK
jgi:polysaccharide export outer membrane protein